MDLSGGGGAVGHQRERYGAKNPQKRFSGEHFNLLRGTTRRWDNLHDLRNLLSAVKRAATLMHEAGT